MIGRIRGARHVRSASTLLALLAGVSFAGAAAAQGANPFAFLFGGSQSEGRSAYAPTPGYAPRYAPVPSYSYGAYGQRSYGYSALPGYSDPYDDEGPAERHSGAEGGPHGPTPQEVMAAIKAVKSGKGPLGPFINDPTLRVGDVVVTTKGLMVYRGGGGPSHREGDFVSVSNASGLVANKQTLISLEKASRLTPQKPLGVETKPSRQPAPEVASSATPKVRSAR
ncbi:MAG: hypothetical protein JOZ16_14425 [Methylobacteriaceae bacterium]|nr:hypothetical protein [Methylobacteriaceae bacterium]